MNETARSFLTASARSSQQHIPWTRVVADVGTAHYGKPVDLLAFIRKERENLVLKPSDEYGGTGVTLGWETRRERVGRRHPGGHFGQRPGSRRQLLDRAGTYPHPPRSVSLHHADGQRGIPRHAGGLCALSFPRKIVRLTSRA